MKIKKILFCAAMVSGSVFAKGNYGIHAGVGLPQDAPGQKMGADVGVAAESIFGALGIGVFGTYQMVGLDTGASTGNSLNYLLYGALVNIHLGALYVGGNVGQVQMNLKSGGASVTASSNSYGGQVGMDFPFSGRMSLGLEGRYIKVTSDPSIAIVNGNAQLKFWF
ncbi:MAG: hypothetical protein ABIR96_07340 [Bdellovibrionota bacterium]